jgi:putative DNA primase/helicase
LEGAQGLKKSTALKTIAGDWFTDEIADLGSKDAAMQTRGVWIVEIAELDGMSRTQVSKVKSFMSRSTDRFRPPYGKRVIESPRQCIFAGSVNHSSYLRDETGGRRFWPVACTHIRIDELARVRDQLLAEARDRYRSGAAWWLDSVELNQAAQQEQADRYDGDPWRELVAKWVQSPSQRHDDAGQLLRPFTSDWESVTIADVLRHCIGKAPDEWSQSDQNRVARCLRFLSFERYKARHGADREWRYRRTSA